jgi:hypothetical protein
MNTPTSSIIELRQYTLHPGRRDELIELFEREFIEPQAAVGLRVLGIFGDAERPERFVWFRGFADMAARGAGLAAFYGGPAWQAHRDAANATMIDSDDVLLLRPLTAWPEATAGLWFATVCLLHEAPDNALRDTLRGAGGCWLETEPAENNFPRLPVRSEWAVVALSPQPAVLPEALLRRLRTPPQVLHLQPTSRSPLR